MGVGCLCGAGVMFGPRMRQKGTKPLVGAAHILVVRAWEATGFLHDLFHFLDGCW